jgi:hypothetical protein
MPTIQHDPLRDAVRRAAHPKPAVVRLDLTDTVADDTTTAPPPMPMPWRGYRPPLEHTNSAVAAMDAGDPHPGPVQMYGPERMRVSGWLMFVVGVMLGAACALLWTVFA